METAQDSPKPVLVGRRKRTKSTGSPEKTPDPASNGHDPIIHQEAEAVPVGEPDHSRVRMPSKRLLEPAEMFRYWKSVPEPERSAWLIAYAYRKYPVCDILQPLTAEELREIEKKKRRKPESNCGILSQPLDPDNWEQEVYERWGAGDYQIRLNDQHASVHTTVTECHIRGLRDWDKYPPDLKVDTVVLTDETNLPYLRWARTHGIKFPGDPGVEEIQEEDDMAANAALDRALQSNENLTDKVIEMAKEQRKEAPATPVDANSKGQLGAVETVVEGAKQSVNMMGGVMKQMLENQVRAADPDAHMRHVIEVAKLMTPAAPPPQKDGAADLLAMMRMQMEQSEKNFERILQMQRDSHKETADMLRSRLEKLESERTAAPAANGNGNELAVLDRMLAYKERLDRFAEENAPQPAGPAWLAPVLEFADKGLGNIVTGLQTLRSLRDGPPLATQTAAAELPPAEKRAPEETQEMKMRRQYAQMIHPHLVAAMKVRTPGHEFAAALIGQAGEPTYNGLAQNGYQGIVDFLRSHPPLYAELMQPPIGSTALDKFIEEFLDRGKVQECLQALKGGKPAAPPKHSGPVVS